MIKTYIENIKAKDKKTIGITVGVAVLLISIIIVIIVLATSGKDNTEKETTTKATEKQTEETTEETTTEPSDELPEGKVRSQLTGEIVDEKIGLRRPISVMLNNLQAAVPQAGIEKAGVVLEAPVEGAICRFQAFFEDYDDLDKIGSVRSARTYFVYYSRQFDSIYLHFGEANYALDALNHESIDNLSGLSAVGNKVYYRTTDRVAPHNAYASAEGIAAGIEDQGFRTHLDKDYTGPFIFSADDEQIELTSGQPAIKVVPGYYVNKPWFEYNEKDGLYYRFQYGDKHIDELTGNQLAYKNIIFQNCSYESYYGTEYLNIEMQGKGEGKYFTNGKVIDITWEKKDEFGQTFYYDKDGNQITLNQGKTWICIITESDRVEIYDKLDESTAN
ncbi:MAG: DUF3048 domain-containing protein [Lachnospiraceae bacterium]|nr:DUF3048 domain-containing protein [Lachnospiraceae bacterium]